MATPDLVPNSKRVRRFDARYHDATQPNRNCMCNGRDHGHGAEHQAGKTLQDIVLAGQAQWWLS